MWSPFLPMSSSDGRCVGQADVVRDYENRIRAAVEKPQKTPSSPISSRLRSTDHQRKLDRHDVVE